MLLCGVEMSLSLMLPDGDGETVLRRVRESKQRTRVAVTTGAGDESRLEAVRRLEQDALLRRPITLHNLCRQWLLKSGPGG